MVVVINSPQSLALGSIQSRDGAKGVISRDGARGGRMAAREGGEGVREIQRESDAEGKREGRKKERKTEIERERESNCQSG